MGGSSSSPAGANSGAAGADTDIFGTDDPFGGAASGGATPGGGAPSGSTNGARDPNGPCKALNLFCFDPFDMFTLNPECFTCNNGMGCMDCVDFQAI
jgi:hypothetical protein